ncbi:hypothetical protein C8R46DRAFT_1041503 [Mycena filopes]|nr:hypothetical protein C8R46DRAFT_1041503 [Mycena filopes]
MPRSLTVTSTRQPKATRPAYAHIQQGELKIIHSVPCVGCNHLFDSARWTLNAFCSAQCATANNHNAGAATLPTPPNSPTTAPSERAPSSTRIGDSDSESDAIVASDEIHGEVNALRVESTVAAAFGEIYLQIGDIHEAAASGGSGRRKLTRRLAASLGRKVERLERIYHEEL